MDTRKIDSHGSVAQRAKVATCPESGSHPFVILVSPSSPGSVIPSGQVAIYDGSTQLTQLTLDGNGYASFAMWLLSPGVHNITANYLGDASFAPSQGSVLQSIDGPVLGLAPSSISLTTSLGLSTTQTVTISNPGNGPLTINSIAFAGSTEFLIANNTCPTTPATLAGGTTCTFDFTFRPVIASAVVRHGNVAVKVGVPAVSALINVTGTVAVPTMSVSQTSVSFNPQLLLTASPTQTIAVTNTSSLANLKITAVTIPANFFAAAGPNQCTAMALAAGASCSIYLQFKPYVAGPKSATVGTKYARLRCPPWRNTGG